MELADGERFDSWTVVSRVSGAKYLCRCECGTERVLYQSSLLHRKNPSCGCVRGQRTPKVGDTIGEWTIVEWGGPPSRTALCQCSCGRAKSVEVYTLGRSSLSCGHDRRRRVTDTLIQCMGCGIDKPKKAFHQDRSAKHGVRTRCRDCVREEHEAHREERNQRARERYRANPAAKIARTSEYRRWHPHLGDLRARVTAGGGTYYNVTPQDLAAITAAYHNSCWICGREFSDVLRLSWDHYQPVSAGGDHSRENLRPSCFPCNQRKQARWPFSEKDAEEIRAAVLTREAPTATSRLSPIPR